MEDFGAPYVIKADGLAAGKGVIVTDDSAAALDHAKAFIDMGILVEEFISAQKDSNRVLHNVLEEQTDALVQLNATLKLLQFNPYI
jgi:phosphoribosylamine-glycine ligase